VYITAARSPPRSEPANSHDLRRPLGGVVGEADPSVFEEAREGGPALEHVIHRLGDVTVARELGALLPHPGLELGDERLNLPLKRVR
jgi:hypothetical protein